MPSRKLSPRMVACLMDAKEGFLLPCCRAPYAAIRWARIAGGPQFLHATLMSLMKRRLVERRIELDDDEGQSFDEWFAITPAGLAALKEIDDAGTN